MDSPTWRSFTRKLYWIGFQVAVRLRSVSLAAIAKWMAVAVVLVLVFGVATSWFVTHWSDPEQAPIVDFLAVWLPFVLSIALSFFPDQQWRRRTRVSWRLGVMAFGFLYSVVLWQQQSLSRDSSEASLATAITKAVTDANTHSDEKIGEVRADLKGLEERTTGQAQKGLESATRELSRLLQETREPVPELAKLTFSFRPPTATEFPVLEMSYARDADGAVDIPVTVRNESNVSAIGGDLWVLLCRGCRFASEPEGFQKAPGSDDGIRILPYQRLNAGTIVQFKMRVLPPAKGRSFKLAFHYACETCPRVGRWEQQLTVLLKE